MVNFLKQLDRLHYVVVALMAFACFLGWVAFHQHNWLALAGAVASIAFWLVLTYAYHRPVLILALGVFSMSAYYLFPFVGEWPRSMSLVTSTFVLMFCIIRVLDLLVEMLRVRIHGTKAAP